MCQSQFQTRRNLGKHSICKPLAPDVGMKSYMLGGLVPCLNQESVVDDSIKTAAKGGKTWREKVVSNYIQ